MYIPTLHCNLNQWLTIVVLQCRDRTFCQFFFSNETRKLTLICSKDRRGLSVRLHAGSTLLHACVQPLGTPQLRRTWSDEHSSAAMRRRAARHGGFKT